MRSLGGGRLVLFPAAVRDPFTPGKVAKIRTLLESQPYVHGVRYAEAVAGAVELYRYYQWNGHGRNLADFHLSMVGRPHRERRPRLAYGRAAV